MESFGFGFLGLDGGFVLIDEFLVFTDFGLVLNVGLLESAA